MSGNTGNRYRRLAVALMATTGLAGALAGLAPLPARADTVIDGATQTVTTNTNYNDFLFVGLDGTGRLNIQSGARVSSWFGTVGFNAGSNGTVNVTGAGSEWNDSNRTYIGYTGTGTLNVTNGGAVTGNTITYIGYRADGVGTATVTGAGSSWTTYNLTVGERGTGTLTIANGGTVSAVSGSSTVTLGLTASGNGTLNIGAAAGNAATGAGTLNATEFIFGNGNGTLNFNHTDADYDFGAGMTGSGTVIHLTGVTNLTGDSSGFTGTTTITGGTLSIGSGGTSGSIGGDIVNNATLVFNRSDELTLAGAISGTGAVQQNGGGSTTLTGTNSYSGATTVNGGTLSVNGSIASSSGVTVNSGGTLGGSGTTSGVTVNAGGTLAAGNSIGTLNTGDLTLAGTLLTEIDAGGNMDLVNVTGTVDLTGGTLDLRGYGDISTLAIETQGAIISNDGSDAVVGTFGSGVGLNGDSTLFSTVTTTGGDGNDVDLGVFRTGIALANGATNSETVTFPTSYTGFTFTVDGSDAAIFAGSFGETASGVSVNKAGSGKLTLTSANTYSGGSTVSGGTLELSGAGTLGATNGTLAVSGGTLDLGGTSQTTGALTFTGGTIANGTLTSSSFGLQSGTVSAALAGAGTLTKTGAGELVLSGANTYSGNTTVNGGTLSVSGSIANSDRTTVNNAALNISGTVNSRFGLVGDDVGSNGMATVDGAGSTWTNSQTLVVGNSGTGTLNVANGGAVSSNAGYVGNSSGADGTVNVDGAGSSWTNSSFLTVSEIGAGNLNVTNGGGVSNTFGFVGSGVGSNGAVMVDGTGSTWTNSQNLFVGDLGTGTLTIANGGAVSAGGGSGTVTIGRDAGATGTLNIGAASGSAAMGAGTLDAASVAFGNGTGALNFNHTHTDYDFDPAITGAGTINQIAGMTNLTGDNSGFVGTTNITGGTLNVNDALGGTVNAAGGKLGGSGAVGALTVNAGGALSPGNSIGTLTVNGNLTLAGGSTYNVEVSPAAADRTNVTGSADLSGATVVTIYEAGSYVAKQYVILNAGAGLGGTTFAGLAGTAPTGLAQSLAYDANNVYLVLTLAFPSGLDANQQSIADMLQNYFDQNGTLPADFTGLSASGLTALSGEVSTGAVTAGFNASDQFLNQLTGDGGGSEDDGAGSGIATAYAEPEEGTAAGNGARERLASLAGVPATTGSIDAVFDNRWRGWGSVYGEAANVAGSATTGSANFSGGNWGVMGAFERQVGAGRVGLALGGGGASYALAGGHGSGSAGIFNAGLYGTARLGEAYLSGAAAYGFDSVMTTRIVGADTLTGSYGAHVLSARLEAGRAIRLGGTSLAPYAAARGGAYFMPGYSETSTGSTTYALTYGAQSFTDFGTELGVRLARTIPLKSGSIELTGRVAWAWNSARSRSLTAAFQALPGSSFSVAGAIADQNAVLVDAGANMRFGRNVKAGLSFHGAFSANSAAYGGKARLGVTW